MPTFNDLSKDIVCDFLHNVVLADDRIEFKSDALPSVIISATRETAAVTKPEPEIKVSEKAVDVKPLLDEFILKGIPCSFLVLKNSVQPIVYSKNLKKADAIILDWQVESDGGDFILQLLDYLIGKDNNSLRVILIYTGFPDLKSIIQKIKEKFSDISFETDPSHECSIRCGFTLISVYAKIGLSVDPGLSNRVVNEKQLVNALINEFTSMTAGLITNVALSSITAIRNNTFKILSVFNKEIDPAFLSHRALLSNPEESQENLTDIIISEISGLLKHSDVGDHASMSKIKLWLNRSNNSSKYRKRMHIKKCSEAMNELEKILEKGIPNISNSKNKNKTWATFLSTLKNETDKTKLSDLTKIFSDSSSPEELDKEFALLMSFQSNYHYLPPKLDQGTLLKCQSEQVTKYYVCIQPKCDCYRVKKSGEYFIFLSIREVATPQKINLIVKENNVNRKFNLDNHPQNVEKFKFSSKKNGLSVFAEESNSRWYFKGLSIENVSTNFEFLGYLKQDFSQRLVSNFANNLSRIGLSESEWLRRWSK